MDTKELYKQKEAESFFQEQQNIWNNHNCLTRGNPKRIYEGRDFTEVKPKTLSENE